MKILVLTKYGQLGASSRMRFYQYYDYLKKDGFEIDTQALLDDKYLINLYSNKKRALLSIFKAYAKRLSFFRKINHYNLIWLEGELFVYFPAIFERLFSLFHKKFVVDYDDAVFHTYDLSRHKFVRAMLGRKIDVVMQHANLVVAGNRYIETRAKNSGAKKVVILPTVIDLDRYDLRELKKKDTSSVINIGWVGSPATVHYLEILIPVFEKMSKTIPLKLTVVGAKFLTDYSLSFEISYKQWSEDTEIKAIFDFDIGVMPLTDDPWSKGKCGYKLIQYMACAKPVIASPVGVNTEIVSKDVGFLANSEDEWENAIGQLFSDEMLRNKLGAAGRKLVEERYSLQSVAPALKHFFTDCLKEQ